jgi:hypothetical protein
MSKELDYINYCIVENECHIKRLDTTGYPVEIQKQYSDYLFKKREILSTIKQALTTKSKKEQKTPKKYLTYDDLMKLEPKSYKVLLNGSEYKMKLYQYDYGKEICFSKNGKIVLYRLLFDTIAPFFNDLHLELVEE